MKTAILIPCYNEEKIKQNYEAGPTDNLIPSKNNFEVLLYPNPSRGKITFDIKPAVITEFGNKTVIQLVDLNGIILFEEVLKDSSQPYKMDYDLSDFNKGVYYLRVFTSETSEAYKLIIY